MTATAPLAFTRVHDRHVEAGAPVTMDLASVLTRDLHHNYVRIASDAGGMNVEGGLVGHRHAGGDNGMPMPRHIDGLHRAGWIGSAQSAWLYASDGSPEHTSILHAKLDGSHTNYQSITGQHTHGGGGVYAQHNWIEKLLVSPGVQYIGLVLKYSLAALRDGFTTGQEEFYKGLPCCGITFRVGPAGGSMVIPPQGIILYPTHVFDSLASGNVTQLHLLETGKETQRVYFGPRIPPSARTGIADAEENPVDVLNTIADISAYTGQADPRLFNLRLEVKWLPWPDGDSASRLWIWGYDLYELVAPPEVGGPVS